MQVPKTPLPSTAEAVIVAPPTAIAVTKPSSTVATLSLLLVHVIAGFVAVDGLTVATSCNSSSTYNVVETVSKVMVCTGIALTVKAIS